MARRNEAEILLTAKDRTKAAFSSANRNLGRYGSIGLAGAAAGVVLLTRASLQHIDVLAKQAKLLGDTTQNLAAFRLVAEKTGIEQKVLEKSLINVTRVVAEAAEGTGLAVDTLKKLGLEAVNLAKLSPSDQFLEISDAMKGLNTESEKVLASYELFGGRGAALKRTLEAGRDAFDEAREKTERFGTAISAVDARSIEDANDAATDLRESIRGVGFDLARRFAPGMEAASTSSANFIVMVRREFIPAMALMLEQLNIIQNNVRGLSDIELAVRVEVQADKIAALDDDLRNALAPAKELFKVFGQPVTLEKFVDPAEVEAELKAAQERLASVKAEQQRRADFILNAERKLEEQKKGQREEARLTALELEREQEQERFEESLESEAEQIEKRVSLAKRGAREFERIARGDVRAKNRAFEVTQKFEERTAINTIRLRQATARTSVQILQTLVGKSKGVARALFLVEKGLAIARTIQNTAAASVKALAELGPIAGPPAAAAITAFGAAQVGLIAATALAGVGSVGGAGAPTISGDGGIGSRGDDFGGGTFGSDEQPGGGGTALESQGVVQLIFPSLFAITPEVVDALADALREASENRDVIVVSGQGRNAELLQGANG